MKNQNTASNFFEDPDFSSFNERELEMIIGGGSEDPVETFFDKKRSVDRDETAGDWSV